MRIHLAGVNGMKNIFENKLLDFSQSFLLESFYTLKDWELKLIDNCGCFLLDSGAYTFMQAAQKHGNIDWLSYADKYADFIKDNNIRNYFELDIDNIKGLKYAEMLRNRIEARCGKPSIPVWHVERGKDYFLGMIKDYKYVALGSIANVVNGKRKMQDKYFPWFIGQAHKENCKIHALGYTNLEGLSKYHFDSVDSTTWTIGGRFGVVMQFEKGTIKKHNSVINGKKERSIKDIKFVTLHNLKEWMKFQRFADKYL